MLAENIQFLAERKSNMLIKSTSLHLALKVELRVWGGGDDAGWAVPCSLGMRMALSSDAFVSPSACWQLKAKRAVQSSPLLKCLQQGRLGEGGILFCPGRWARRRVAVAGSTLLLPRTKRFRQEFFSSCFPEGIWETVWRGILKIRNGCTMSE